MASVDQIKAGLQSAASEGQGAIAQAKGAKDAADRMLNQLRAVAQGTNHPKLQEAMAKAEQAKQKLDEASALASGAAEAARAYIALLG